MTNTLNPRGLAPLLLLAAAAWLWAGAMAAPPGVICGLHAGALQPHCWRCFAAAALALAGLAGLGLRLSTTLQARR